jgi:type I restriction enzyme M protein
MEFPQRFRYGFAPEKGKKADLMFAQHMIASLNNKGVMATVMPHGVLFRGGAEKAIRQGIVRADIIEAIISLPPNLFYGTGIPACILVINKTKPKNLENKILFINADAEYGEGRAQNYLRPEDIEKITFVFESKREEPKYSRLVDLDEIEKNDFNLNIRRYVDNSPDTEIEDVHAHLVGGIPKREIALHEQEFGRYGLASSVMFDDKDQDYGLFKPAITERHRIREIIEGHPAIMAENKRMEGALARWWEAARADIESLPHHNRVAQFRRESIEQLKKRFTLLTVLDEFQVAGLFVNWWEAVRWDMKAIVAAGWTPSLIPDDYIRNAFFKKELDELEALETTVAELDSNLSELFDEVGMDENGEEENGKPVKSIKAYLNEQIIGLGETETDSAVKEKAFLEAQLQKLEAGDKELKKLKKALKEKEEELRNKIDGKRQAFTEAEAKELVLKKFYDLALDTMYRYLNSRKRTIFGIVENLWDKYRTPLSDLAASRDKASRHVDEFLRTLQCLR